MKSQNSSTHRAIEKEEFFMGERYPLHIYWHGFEHLEHLFESLFLVTPERGEIMPLRIDLLAILIGD